MNVNILKSEYENYVLDQIKETLTYDGNIEELTEEEEKNKIIIEKLDDFVIPDLCNKNHIKVLFILESPHIQEVSDGIPVSGSAGLTMTNFLQNNYSLGQLKNNPELLDEIDELDNKNLQSIGIMNSSRLPLQTSCYKKHLKDLNDNSKKNINVLQVIKHKLEGEKPTNKKIRKIDYDEEKLKIIEPLLENDFKSRINPFIEKNNTCKLIIPCGKVASSLVKKTIGKNSKLIPFDVHHPSYFKDSSCFHKGSLKIQETDSNNYQKLRKEIYEALKSK